MCQVKCPVKINTGELIKQLRSDELEGGGHPRATKAAMVGRHDACDVYPITFVAQQLCSLAGFICWLFCVAYASAITVPACQDVPTSSSCMQG